MNIDDWDRQGLEPGFGHQGAWLQNDMDRIDSPMAAAFALLDEPSAAAKRSDRSVSPSEQARRFLLATKLGLVDAHYAPDGDAPGPLSSRLIPWPDVRGVLLMGKTTLDDALRHVTRWRLTVEHPAVDIDEPPDDDALIEFWRECVLRAGRPPTEKAKNPE